MSVAPRRKPKPIDRLAVQLDHAGTFLRLGTLAWKQSERRAYFEYDRETWPAAPDLSPFHLPREPGLHAAALAPFEGLHGLFADSLPDGWGRRLLDRHLLGLGLDPNALTPLDRLAHVGTRGMGALTYRPDIPPARHGATGADLDWLAEQIRRVQEEEDAVPVDQLLGAQGGSAGVRPKLMIGLNPDTEQALLDHGDGLPTGFEPWLIKFPSPIDPPDIGAQEHAYALMAQAAGITMAQTRLLATKSDRYFATKRFDRTKAGRLHVHTASGLLHASHRAPEISYDDLLKLTLLLTRDARDVAQMFRRMVFNVLAHNRDDHARNHAFRLDALGAWHPSPAYDLTFSQGPGGEHSLAIAGEGRAPERSHLMQVAAKLQVKRADADGIIGEVSAAVARFPSFALDAGLSRSGTTRVREALARIKL